MKPEVCRDVLFGAGCVLALFGLFPYLQQAQFRASHVQEHLASSPSNVCLLSSRYPQQQFVHSSTSTAFDLVTCFISVTFALFGTGAMMLSLVLMPTRALRVCVRVLGVPMAVLSAQSLLLALAIYSQDEVVQMWQDSILRNFGTQQLAHQMNDVYCRALVHQIQCLEQEPRLLLGRDDDLLTPSHETALWCKKYISSEKSSRQTSMYVEDQHSPYSQHRREILTSWENSPVALNKSARLLLVLAATSVPAILVLAQWHAAPALA